MTGSFLSDMMISFAMRVGIALIISLVGLLLVQWLLRLMHKLLARTDVDAVFSRFATSIARILLLVLVAATALNEIGIDTQYLFAILTGLLVAVGLALQDSLTNVAAGMRLFLRQPFRQGQEVQIGDVKGNVVEIALMTTHLRTDDHVDVILPNSTVVTATLQNFHSRPIRRIDMVVRIRYQDSIAKAREVLVAVMKADERVLEDPAPKVTVAELEDFGVRLNVRPWVKNRDHGPTKADLLERFVSALEEKGIKFPSQKMAVHLSLRDR